MPIPMIPPFKPQEPPLDQEGNLVDSAPQHEIRKIYIESKYVFAEDQTFATQVVKKKY